MIGPLENMREKVAMEKRKKAEEIRALKKKLKSVEISSPSLRKPSPLRYKSESYEKQRKSIGVQIEETFYKDASQSTDLIEGTSVISTITLPDSPIKVPIYIPQSLLRKVQKLPPPAYHKALPSGEVITVHMVGQDTPTSDPILKLEVLIDPKTLQGAITETTPTCKSTGHEFSTRVESEAESIFSGARSLSPRRQETVPKLTPAPVSIRGSSVREATPTLSANYVNFRDFALDE